MNSESAEHDFPSEDTILLPNDDDAERAGLSDALREAVGRHRQEVLQVLRQIPAFSDAIRKLTADDRIFRVLVSKENARFFRQGVDGAWKPYLRDATGRFVENVDLVPITPNVAGSLNAIAVQAALTEISAKLDVVIQNVENLAALVRLANQGSLQGAIDSLEVARRLQSPAERRKQMLEACQQIIGQIGTVAGQMAAHIGQMPPETTGFRDGWRTGRDKAEGAYTRVRDDFAVVADGLRQVVMAYIELGEYAAAQQAFERICGRLTDADLQQAADRARLLPYPKGGPGPERLFEAFIEARPVAEARLRTLVDSGHPALALELRGRSHQ